MSWPGIDGIRKPTGVKVTSSHQAKILGEEKTMKKIDLFEANDFSDKGMKKLLVHDSPYFKILNFNGHSL
jgi:hypothetical protein